MFLRLLDYSTTGFLFLFYWQKTNLSNINLYTFFPSHLLLNSQFNDLILRDSLSTAPLWITLCIIGIPINSTLNATCVFLFMRTDRNSCTTSPNPMRTNASWVCIFIHQNPFFIKCFSCNRWIQSVEEIIVNRKIELSAWPGLCPHTSPKSYLLGLISKLRHAHRCFNSPAYVGPFARSWPGLSTTARTARFCSHITSIKK